ncbi:MAG: hypothetical protein GY749_41710 [Desulfobacteraceae bacterium]|nr:hypothetical protein [Desulfobacteraceae bacterium]
MSRKSAQPILETAEKRPRETHKNNTDADARKLSEKFEGYDIKLDNIEKHDECDSDFEKY